MEKKTIRLSVTLSALVIVFLLASWSMAADHSVWLPRPIPLGVSGINKEEVCSAGTLGSLVQKIKRDVKFILSNNHVLARENDGVKGELIIQPGSLDDGCQFRRKNKVAKLKKFIPIVFSTSANNEVDAAIAKVIAGKVDESGTILDIGMVSTVPLDPQMGMAVKKAGRTTDLTFGAISDVGVTVNVQYSSGVARFINQFFITWGPTDPPFSAPGDSGSLIVTDEASCPHPVGLLFAGSSTVTVANPIKTVYQKLKVKPVGCPGAGAEGALTGEMVQRDERIAQAIQVKARHEEQLLNVPGVVGVGIGLSKGQVVIKVFLEEMTPELMQKLPDTLDGFSVVPEVTGKIIAY
jgi:hypothetical protein